MLYICTRRPQVILIFGLSQLAWFSLYSLDLTKRMPAVVLGPGHLYLIIQHSHWDTYLQQCNYTHTHLLQLQQSYHELGYQACSVVRMQCPLPIYHLPVVIWQILGSSCACSWTCRSVRDEQAAKYIWYIKGSYYILPFLLHLKNEERKQRPSMVAVTSIVWIYKAWSVYLDQPKPPSSILGSNHWIT